jgi:hypothetical protein
MRPHVPDDQLTLAGIPNGDAAWAEVVRFGHSYHAYKIAGSVQRVAQQAMSLHDGWADDGSLDAGLSPLRLSLFHAVRALEHGSEPDAGAQAWARALVAAIRGCIADLQQ